MANLIAPRTLSGFRDYLPDVMLAREKVLDIARRVYRSYGFTPIDTPACEALDVLLGKGGDESDKLVYRVRSAKSEKEEMGLRFDLTVPFARFSAQYINQLGTPFKRYAMGPVWRGERPGQGRYREFWQCDFDTIGTTSNASDIETVLVINDLFTAIGFEKFEIRVNNRMVLNGVLDQLGAAEKAVHVLRTIDKLPKIGRDAVAQELVFLSPGEANAVRHEMTTGILQNMDAWQQLMSTQEDQFVETMAKLLTPLCEQSLVNLHKEWLAPLCQRAIWDIACMVAFPLKNGKNPTREDLGIWLEWLPGRLTGVSPEQAQHILDFVSLSADNSGVLESVNTRFGTNKLAADGIRRLRELLAVAKTVGVPEGRIKIDLSICRGLDYYTGTIYETFLTDLPSIGSVCSGGRYDNLASLYTKQVLPGVGASLGVDRLIAAMEAMQHPLLTGQSTPAEVLVVNFDASRLGDYQRIARDLRTGGVNVEVYPEAKKIGPQLGYAEKRGFKLAVIAGPAEFDAGMWKVKDLAKREEIAVPTAELVARVKALIG